MMRYQWHEAIWRYGRWDVWHPGAIIGLALLVLIMVLVIVGIVALVRYGRSKSAIRENGALTIARERYARG